MNLGAYIAECLLLSFLGFLVFYQSRKSKLNVYFFVATIWLTLWVFANYFAERFINQALFWSRAAFFANAGAIVFFWLFAFEFPRRQGLLLVSRLMVGLGASIMAVSFTPYFIPRLEQVGDITNVVPGILYLLFPVYLGLSLIGLPIAFGSKLKGSPLDQRRHIRLVIVGVVLMGSTASITNLFLPLITGSNESAGVGTLSTLFFIVITSYTIIKHRLFDIRAIVARAFAYALSLSVIVSVFAVVFFTASQLLSFNNDLTVNQQIFYVVSSLLIALLLQPIRRFFNKLTNKVFYRDAYDIQTVLDRISDVTVGNIDSRVVLGGVSKIICDSIKASICGFYILNKDGSFNRSMNLPKASSEQDSNLTSLLNNSSSNIVIYEDIGADQQELKSIMRSLDIVGAFKLNTSDELIGYMLVGPKRSGGVYASRDIRLLGIIADQLAITVQNSLRFEEIEQFNETLQGKVDTATAELRETNEKLKALDEAKDEFISMASHQLRTPLTSIKGYLSMVLDGDTGKITKEQQEYINQAFMSSQRMVNLIADLLNVSRIHTGKFKIDRTEINFPELVQAEVDQLKESAKARKIDFTYTSPADFPTFQADETKTHQVVMNLMDNALYYTPAGGKVEVSVEHDDKFAIFKVKDSGIGVAPGDQKHLFTKFYRAENAKEARPDGTGIGLFMCKKVVDAQGGEIIFESQVGKGSTFGFKLPLTPPAEVEVPATEL